VGGTLGSGIVKLAPAVRLARASQCSAARQAVRSHAVLCRAVLCRAVLCCGARHAGGHRARRARCRGANSLGRGPRYLCGHRARRDAPATWAHRSRGRSPSRLRCCDPSRPPPTDQAPRAPRLGRCAALRALAPGRRASRRAAGRPAAHRTRVTALHRRAAAAAPFARPHPAHRIPLHHGVLQAAAAGGRGEWREWRGRSGPRQGRCAARRAPGERDGQLGRPGVGWRGPGRPHAPARAPCADAPRAPRPPCAVRRRPPRAPHAVPPGEPAGALVRRAGRDLRRHRWAGGAPRRGGRGVARAPAAGSFDQRWARPESAAQSDQPAHAGAGASGAPPPGADAPAAPPLPPGTSPLYSFQAVLSGPPTREEVLAAGSLFVWTLTLIVLVKYVGIVLRFDDNGEGERGGGGGGGGGRGGRGRACCQASRCGSTTTARVVAGGL
jgi:hypothetical protein